MTTDDDELAIRAGAGDAQAFRVLLERHYERINYLSLCFFGSREDADDLSHEICVALPKKLRSFKGRSRFSTWLYQVVINACRDRVRRRGKRKALDATYSETLVMALADQRDTEERLCWLYRALAVLNPDLRETALLVIAEDMTHAQAGEVLGVKEATVSWRMHEIRKELKILALRGDGELT